MKLEGKFKRDFNEWLKLNWNDSYLIPATADDFCDLVTNFNKLPFSMQYGVFVDFADSVNIIISIDYYKLSNKWEYDISQYDVYNGHVFMNRTDCQKAALEKAQVIYNKS